MVWVLNGLGIIAALSVLGFVIWIREKAEAKAGKDEGELSAEKSRPKHEAFAQMADVASPSAGNHRTLERNKETTRLAEAMSSVKTLERSPEDEDGPQGFKRRFKVYRGGEDRGGTESYRKSS